MRSFGLLGVALSVSLACACGGHTSGTASGQPPGSSGGETTPGGGDTTPSMPPTPATGDKFKFAVFGDARPDQVNDTKNWPSQVVTSIFQTAQNLGAQFMIGTGDYMFANYPNAVDPQLDALLAAEKVFSGPIYLAMGNHECTGASASNCPTLEETSNVREFLKRAVPFSKLPYFSFKVTSGKGVAKFVFLAPNAWNDAQSSWLKQALAEKTDYTFIVRHQPSGNTQAQGAIDSDPIIAAVPYTLLLVGHSHEYLRVGPKEVISGNGGAPITHGSYGFLMIEQQDDGTISVSEIEQATGMAVDTFRLAPDGTAK